MNAARRTSTFRVATAMLGTIIGAGVFGLPAALKDNGILAGSLIFWAMALVVLATHLLYADVIIRTPTMMMHRLPGQVKRLLGNGFATVAFLSHPMQIIGSCFAYLILGGEFLAVLASLAGFSAATLVWQVVFWAAGAVAVFLGLRFIAKLEAPMAWLLVGLLLISTAFFLNGADGSRFVVSHWTNILAPLGVFLFALSGMPAVPEVVALADLDPVRSRLGIAIGSLAAALLMWLFAVFALAKLGNAITSNPADLVKAFPPSLMWLIPAAGFLSVGSCFMILMQDLKSMLRFDAHLAKPVAWALALLSPLMLLFIIPRDFLAAVSVVGSIFGSINGILIAFMAIKIRQKDRGHILVRYGIPGVVAGVFLVVLIWRMLSIGNIF
ncbi:MAG: aromatic amino acid transport family protein [Patescibacteria group bacterium]